MNSLYGRLSLTLLLVFLLLGALYSGLILWGTEQYHRESTQRLNQSLAMYIAQREPLLIQGEPNHPAMKTLASLVMVVNPLAEVYLLDHQGSILAHVLEPGKVTQTQVDLAPIRKLLAHPQQLPVLGVNPRSGLTDSVFSVFPLTDAERLEGYLYVVLKSAAYENISASLKSSVTSQQLWLAVLLTVFFGFICAWLLFRSFSRPLADLAHRMDHFYRHELNPQEAQTLRKQHEIATLETTFEAMQARIRQQVHQLQETDRMRRELVSNVSHDLRTPLSSMQGYLEMLLIKADRVSATERQQAIQVAYRHCQKLARLINELFELSKLDAGLIKLNIEHFSLAELMQDVVQKFSLQAQQRQVQLELLTPEGSLPVQADIGLLERVLDNLVDNALRHTPAGGQVQIRMNMLDEQVRIAVVDTGVGMEATDIPKIFERYYRIQTEAADLDQPQQASGTGLGLAIVKRILELHGSVIRVASIPKQGSCFSFHLPIAEPA